MSLQICLLAAVCLLAFCRPLWGFVSLVILTSSLFSLDRYATVPLPLGYVGPTEAVLCVLFLRLLPGNSRLQKGSAVRTGQRARFREPLKRLLLIAVVPYALWQTGCVVAKLPTWWGTAHFRFGVRYLLSAVLPWITPFLLLKLGARSSKVFNAAFYVTLTTATLHIALQVTDHRPLMLAAYTTVSPNGEYAFLYSQAVSAVGTQGFYRALPQGTALIMFFAVLYLGRYCLRQNRTHGQMLTWMLLVTALGITFTRSIMVSLLAGLVFALLLGSWARVVRGRTIGRLIAVVVLTVSCGAAYEAVRPGFWAYWSERVALLAGQDAEIFSQENKARGLDNIASWNAITDHPFLGLGTPRYPSEYSLRDVPATDIHPMLQIGLIGGIPAMLLALWLQLSIIWYFCKRIHRRRYAGQTVAPFLAVLCMSAFVINTIGGGGTVSGSGILAMSIFIVEMARQPELAYARPAILRTVPPSLGKPKCLNAACPG